MVDWKSPEVLAANAMSFTLFLHVILGLYLWEWATTLDFDLEFLTGHRKFKWPLIPYFYGRYAMLIGIIGFIVALNVRTEIDCQALYIVLQILGNTALGVASVNLAIRTIAVWGQSMYIVVPLVILILGQFAIIFRSCANVHAVFIPGAGCATTSIDSTIFAAMYIYTMVVDFIVLVLTSYKLVMDTSTRTASRRSPIVSLLFKDGLIYFIVAFGGNLIAVIFSMLKLNDVMSLIADIPATTFATIVACRCVRRLNNYATDQSVQIYTSKHRTNPISSTTGGGPKPTQSSTGVRIQMSTFTHGDDESDLEGQKLNTVQEGHVPGYQHGHDLEIDNKHSAL